MSLHGDVVDPVGDARVVPANPGASNPADLVLGTADVSGGNIVFRIRFAPGTFSTANTLFTIEVNVDQDSSTGIAGYGHEYEISGRVGSSLNAQVIKWQGSAAVPGAFDRVGSAQIAVATDGVDISVPLSLLGGDDGRVDFRVDADTLVGPGLIGALDNMPDASLPAGRVQ